MARKPKASILEKIPAENGDTIDVTLYRYPSRKDYRPGQIIFGKVIDNYRSLTTKGFKSGLVIGGINGSRPFDIDYKNIHSYKIKTA